MSVKSSNPGLDRLGPTSAGLRLLTPMPNNNPFGGRNKKRLTRKDIEAIQGYRAKMAKLFTVERLTDDAKRIRNLSIKRRGNRPPISLAKVSLPPTEDE